MGDPRDNNDLADEVVRRLAAEFGPKHVDLQHCITRLCDRVLEVERRLNDIERQQTYSLLLDQANHDTSQIPPQSLVPDPTTARPLAIDRACAATPDSDATTALIPEFGTNGLEIKPAPGADPETLWPLVIGTINAARR